ncbi:MAG: dimethylmenaquinone methyltransferase [Proteobacteria bacterium]|nr:dimethylmenaquinone methyltransferase [Pseudomonadota bacterium]
MAVIVHPRTDKAPATADLERWRNVPAAIVADVSKGAALVDPDIRPLCPAAQQPRLFGRAVTVKCSAPDFGAVLWSLDLVRKGDVLVIDAQGHRDHAMIGGILGAHLRRLGAAGIVCDGAVRDVMELAAWDDFSVFSRHVTPRGPTALDQGEVNGVVSIGGRQVSPGDLVIGDDDGLVVLSDDMIRTLIAAAEEKLSLEDKWIKSLEAGTSVNATFGLK